MALLIHARLTDDRVIRAGATAGIVGPVLFTVGFVAQNVLRTDDDWVAEPVSALGTGRLGWVQDVSFVVLGTLTLCFGVALWRALGDRLSGRVAAGLVLLSGVGPLLAAAFPLARAADGEVYDPGNHFVAGVTFFGGTACALLALGIRFLKDPAWRAWSAYTLVCAGLALAGFVGLGRFAIPDGSPLHDVAGLLQRVVLVVAFSCLVPVAARLRRATG